MSSLFHMFCFIYFKRKSTRMVLSTFPFYGWGKWGTEAWMKLTSNWKTCVLVRDSSTLCKIHENVLWLSRLWGNKSRFQFCLLKKTWSMLLGSTKQCPGYFTCSASFNYKENLQAVCYQHSHFIDEETEVPRCSWRDKWVKMMGFLWAYVSIPRKLVGKGFVYLDCWGKKIRFQYYFSKKQN